MSNMDYAKVKESPSSSLKVQQNNNTCTTTLEAHPLLSPIGQINWVPEEGKEGEKKKINKKTLAKNPTHPINNKVQPNILHYSKYMRSLTR